MRAPALTAGFTVALVFAAGPYAWASRDCQIAFESWAKLSGEQVRVAAQSESGRGACVPTEAVRQDLLDGLARARTLCAESASSDQSLQQTRALLNINQTFIASLLVCRSDSADAGAGWVTKSAPTPNMPIAPAPPPPRRPVVAAPPPSPPKPVAAAAPPPAPPCLEIAPAKEEHYELLRHYSLNNRRCRGHTVLAVIETRGAAGETVCRGYAISQSVAVRTFRDRPPRVNFECVASQGRCNRDRLGGMFPECDW